MTSVRKGQAPAQLPRDEFGRRFRDSFVDPAFAPEKEAIARLEEIAWQGYDKGRKAPITRKAGLGYADPTTTWRSNGWRPRTSSTRRRPRGLTRRAPRGCCRALAGGAAEADTSAAEVK